ALTSGRRRAGRQRRVQQRYRRAGRRLRLRFGLLRHLRLLVVGFGRGLWFRRWLGQRLVFLFRFVFHNRFVFLYRLVLFFRLLRDRRIVDAPRVIFDRPGFERRLRHRRVDVDGGRVGLGIGLGLGRGSGLLLRCQLR